MKNSDLDINVLQKSVGVLQDNLVLSTELTMKVSHRKEIESLYGG